MEKLSIKDLESYIFNKKGLAYDVNDMDHISDSFDFLTHFAEDKIIYGINTGFGPMAQYKIDEHELEQLQYNLIRSHSCGVGKPLSDTYARSVMLARLNTFMQGNSGVSLGVVKQLISFLDNNIIPEIPEHGSVGASGDLVQLAHLGLNLIGEGYVYLDGVRTPAADALAKFGLQPLKLELRDGLGLINGTSCMTGIAAVNLIHAKRLLSWSIVTSSMINELVSSFNDSFSEELNATKLHKGQREVAASMRSYLADSKMVKERAELFADNAELQKKQFKKKIQEYYSIRCVPQILGPIADTIAYAEQVIENELNSTNDNPVVNAEIGNVFHGGNFHGDYISLEMDKLKIAITKLTMLAERQLNFMMNHRLNDKFPPFLNGGKLGFNFGYQGLQFTATSTTAESQSLSTPVYVHSIPNNNDNQDVVSMGTNSALIARHVLENGFQVMAIHLMALCQAVDLLPEGERKDLSKNTERTHSEVRQHIVYFTDDAPRTGNIQSVVDMIKEKEFEL